MQQLNWITPKGIIANFAIGIPATTQLLAYNISDRGDTIFYSLVDGSLPPGVTMSPTGIISGTPSYGTPTDNYFTSRAYTFVVRPIAESGLIGEDNQFTVVVNNIVNADFTWVTPAGNLGTVPDGEFFQYQLQVEQTYSGGNITFKFISGQLPPGLQLTPSGLLQGVPTILNPIAVNQSETYRFTVRAKNELDHIVDQSFSISVTNVYGPIVRPTTTYLGSVFDGSPYSLQLNVTETNPNVVVQWSNVGLLPPGLTLTSSGLITGLIQPAPIVGNFGPAGYDGASSTSGVIVEQQQFDNSPYDFNQLNQSINYKFTVQAYDGANYDQQDYVLNVVSRSKYTADNTFVSVDNTYLTVDAANNYYPILLNGNVTTLPTGRSGSYYSYKFEGYDFQGDSITYRLTNTVGTFDAYVIGKDAGFDYGSTDPETLRTVPDYTVPGVGFDSAGITSEISGSSLPGLILDEQTGWLYGKLNLQSTALQEYNFGVIVSKQRDGVEYAIDPIYFTLPVLGDITNLINWVSPTYLGTVPTGSICDISIEAVSTAGKTLEYELYNSANVSVKLPQGITLLPTGELSGRVSFQATCIDDFSTTFDGDFLTLDRDCEFTVRAYATDGTISSAKKFQLTIDVIDTEPYEDLYLQALLPIHQRQKLNLILSNEEIFNPDYIYRYNDPWFGIRPKIEMLLLHGLKPSEINAYASAILKNHFTKKYDFGEFKTAVVLDENFQVKYEVVYVDVIDPGENPNITTPPVGPPAEVNLNGIISNPYIDEQGNTYKILYPNSSENMIDTLVSALGYIDQNTLPPWMTSNQLGTGGNSFDTPLGFIKAAVLAYTKPGYSKKIAYRLNNAGINFNEIEFSVDRYFLDNFYTRNYDTDAEAFILGRETTFDQLPNKKVGSIVATVNYGVSIPFNQINGRSVSYINNVGGLDGVTSFRNGDTLIFIQQEGFLNAGPFNGWTRYVDAYIGDNIVTPIIEGYDSEKYDQYNIIPGYLEKSQLSTPAVKTTASAIEVTNLSASFIGDGLKTIFAPLPTASTTTNTVITVNGATLTPVTDYKVSGDTINFTDPPSFNADIQVTINALVGAVTVDSTREVLPGSTVIFQGTGFGGIIPGQSYVIQSIVNGTQFTINSPVSTTGLVSESFIGTGAQTAFILSTTPSTPSISVYVDGIALDPGTDYNLIGSTVSLSVAPGVNSPINITYLTTTGGGAFFSASGSMSASVYSNERGGVWKINIVNDVVSLEFTKEVSVNDRIQILNGQTNSAAVVSYVLPDSPGQTVPYYKSYKYTPSGQLRTTFNNDTTKFFSNRDTYYVPGQYDNYVKFPGTNVFGQTAADFSFFEIVDTAQTKCFNSIAQISPPESGAAFYGQDAQFAGNQPSYTISSTGRTVIDNVTGLQWMKGPNTTLLSPTPTNKKTFSQAQSFVNTVNTINYGGFNDWRLPTIKELYSIIEFSGIDPTGYIGSTALLTPFIDKNFFNFGYGQPGAGEELTDSQYVTSTRSVVTSGNSSTIVYSVNFANGTAQGYDLTPVGQPEQTFFVQLVRGNSYGLNAFVNNNDGTITDNATGLMWSRIDSGSGLDWESALAWVQTKNSQNYLGHNDWRLPNAKELHSIVDFGNSPDYNGLPAIDTAYFLCSSITNEAGINDYPYYWTSTTHETVGTQSGTTAAYIAFGRALGFDSYQNQWVDIHGAGSQRNDPKVPPPYAAPYQLIAGGWAFGPDKIASRGSNFVRVVRDL